MCKFCEDFARVETNFPEDNCYGKLDSSSAMLLKGGVLRIANPEGRGTWANNELPIFQIEVLYCPYCGRKVNSMTNMTRYEDLPITDITFK